MSRFFRSAADSDTESSSDESYISDEELSEEEESEEVSEVEEDEPKRQTGRSRFLRGGDDEDEESEEEEGRRVVKSAKDKRFEEIDASIKVIENAQKINDWVAIQNEFEKLNKTIQKASGVFGGKPPRTYIKALADLEDYMQEVQQKKPKMNAVNSRAMNVMKQKLKKNNKNYETHIENFRKNPTLEDEDEQEEVVVPTTVRPTQVRSVVVDGDAADEEGFTPVSSGGKVMEITIDNLFKKLREVVEARGKKSTDRMEQVRILQRLLEVAQTPYQRIRVLLTLIAAQFDVTPSMSGYMNLDIWKAAEKEVGQLLDILEKHPEYVVKEVVDQELDDDKDIVPAEGVTVGVRGSIVSLIDRLDDEFIKSLQNIDPHTTDYVDRLKDETSLYSLIVRSQCYFERHNLQESIHRIVMRRLEHLYYKPDQVIATVEKTARSMLPDNLEDSFAHVSQDPVELIHSLCVYLYKNGPSMMRTRAMLCHIYHHALHNRFYVARDMLLMSHLQETIHQADIATQVLHNRAMVQVGLCAFKQGLIREAHSCLQDINGTGRVRELLAQGLQMQKFAQLSPEQERMERQRQLPFHMHINLELLECVYLTCSMLLEIPSMAAAGSNPEARKRVLSKPFRRMLDFSERQVFSGPPENTRDHIMGAAKALASGDWEKSRDLITSIKIWDLLPEAPKIKEMLGQKIQEEGLRTYLFTYSSFYDSIGVEQLSKMFGLSTSAVTAIVSKMIFGEELSASLDQVSGCIMLHHVEPTKVQTLSITLAEKAATLVESNERLLEQKNQTTQQQEGGRQQRHHKHQTPSHQTRQTVGGGKIQQRTGGRNAFGKVLGKSVRGKMQQSRNRA
ncbi:uncharacterized protein VTP21DRAFT_8352 [Calcarisporiella thermophila]|uniref:uncharacterized protein n=1 Tax=Calcarisporiella thermophila TaxID=911321 RepID=UPI0037439C45